MDRFQALLSFRYGSLVDVFLFQWLQRVLNCQDDFTGFFFFKSYFFSISFVAEWISVKPWPVSSRLFYCLPPRLMMKMDSPRGFRLYTNNCI